VGALVGGGIATLLSLMVLSRAIGDNPLYRIAQYLLVGVALGYTAAVLVNQALVPPVTQAIIGPFALETWVILGISAGLLVLFCFRFGRQRASYLANIPLAVLFGVGAALALVGAARGTIVPQLLDTIALQRLQNINLGALIGNFALITAVVITLLAFTYTQRTEQPSAAGRVVRQIGRGLVLAAFGVFLAGAVTTYIVALVTQIQVIADWLNQLANF